MGFGVWGLGFKVCGLGLKGVSGLRGFASGSGFVRLPKADTPAPPPPPWRTQPRGRMGA